MKKCSLWFCDRPYYAKGYCSAHYLNWRRFGSPIAPSNKDLQAATIRIEEMATLVIRGSFRTKEESDVLKEIASQVLVNADKIRRENPLKVG